MATGPIIRPLGNIEILSSSRHALGIYRRLANTSRYLIPSIPSDSLANIFEAALAKVVLAQATLQIGIAEESSQKPYFVKLESIDIRQHLEWIQIRNDVDLLHTLENEQVHLFPDVANRPPWKVLVAQNSEDNFLDVVFLVHHALCDGKSAAAFHQFLLEALNEPSQPLNELRDHTLWLPKNIALVPSMEEMIKFNTSSVFLLKTLWQELGPKWLQFGAAPKPWAAGNISIEPYQLHLHKIEFNSTQTASLISACRAHGTTLTGLMHSLLLLSLSQRIPSSVASAFQATTPISLAKIALPPSNVDLEKSLFVAVTGYEHCFDSRLVRDLRDPHGDTDLLLWQVARTVSKALKDRVDTLPNDDVIALLPWVTDWRKFWLNKLGKARSVTWEVSNIGSLRYYSEARNDKWRIDRSIFSQPVMTTGAALSVNVAGVVDGFLTITIGWQESIVDNYLANNVARDLEAWLSSISSTGSWSTRLDS